MERGIPLVGSLSVSQLNSLFSRTLPSSTKALKLNTGNLKVHQRAGKREFNKREEKSSAITGTGVWGPLHHGSVTLIVELWSRPGGLLVGSMNSSSMATLCNIFRWTGSSFALWTRNHRIIVTPRIIQCRVGFVEVIPVDSGVKINWNVSELFNYKVKKRRRTWRSEERFSSHSCSMD